VRKGNGWFGGITELPDMPIDTSVITEDDLKVFVTGLKKTGFFGGDSWCVLSILVFRVVRLWQSG